MGHDTVNMPTPAPSTVPAVPHGGDFHGLNPTVTLSCAYDLRSHQPPTGTRPLDYSSNKRQILKGPRSGHLFRLILRLFPNRHFDARALWLPHTEVLDVLRDQGVEAAYFTEPRPPFFVVIAWQAALHPANRLSD